MDNWKGKEKGPYQLLLLLGFLADLKSRKENQRRT